MSKEYLALLEQGKEIDRRYYTDTNKSELLKENARLMAYNEMQEIALKKRKSTNEYAKFCSNTKRTLLVEYMNNLFKKSLGVCRKDSMVDKIKNNLIDGYVTENGVDSIINKFKINSQMLAEGAYLIEKYYNIIIEKADKDSPETYNVDMEDRDSFFDELDLADTDEVTTAIKMRVTGAIDDFIDKNIKDKIELEDIIKSSSDKSKNIDDENIKESYELQAKRKMLNIRNRSKSVLEAMIYNVCESVRKSEKMQAMYLKENRLDMDSIVENTSTIYTFIEMLNAAKIQKIDESYITEVLNSLKA